MIDLKTKADCSGCHACHNICPKECIIMKFDSEGFIYPEINMNDCINCGLCEKVCQSIIPIYSEAMPVAYAAYNTDEQIRMKSSSGGIFTLLAEYIIDSGGVVFGAAFDDKLNVHHIAVKEKNKLCLLRGSKYVQSTIGDTYKKAKEVLENGRYVLFTGTPCQIDGLLHYLGKEYDNLFTQDLICHGVPSPMVWQKYLAFHAKKSGEIAGEPFPFFRGKEEGWKRYSVLFTYVNNTEYHRSFDKDLYMQAFLHDLCLRPSCYACKSKTMQRNSDITLADFWGIEKVSPEMFDDKGTSLVLVNSEKGKLLFDKIKERLVLEKVDVNEAVKYNPSAYRSVPEPPKRRYFMKTIQNGNFEKVVNKCIKSSFFKRFLNITKRKMKGLLKSCSKTKHY